MSPAIFNKEINAATPLKATPTAAASALTSNTKSAVSQRITMSSMAAMSQRDNNIQCQLQPRNSCRQQALMIMKNNIKNTNTNNDVKISRRQKSSQ